MLIIIILLFLLFAGGGYMGQGNYGFGSWSPLGILLVVVVILLFTGRLR
jgi:hypothetical protein